jgi:cobalt-zinc-cadmium efflux system membrane fusion protein
MKFLFFISALILFASCSSKKTEQSADATKKKEVVTTNTVHLTDSQALNSQIVIGKAEKKEVFSILKVTGKVDVPPQNMVSVSFPLGGYLKSTRLMPGMYVKRGGVLGVLEDIQFIQLQQDYLSAKVRMQFLDADYKRQQTLDAGQATSAKALQQVRSDYESQRILVNSLDAKLRLIGINPTNLGAGKISKSVNIYSPISGYVSKVNVNIGRYISPTDVLFELVNPSDIHLVLTVFQKDVPKLKIGQKVVTYTANEPDLKIPAAILLISQDITQDGSVEVHCHFDYAEHKLLPGMFMSAEIETKNQKAIVLPEEAVVAYENKHYVFLQKSKNEYEMMEVQTGNGENGYVAINEVTSKNIIDKPLVVNNAYSLLMALKNKADE